MRILSLLPAATEIVYFLGLWDQLVGVSADSDWPPEVIHLPFVSQAALEPAELSSWEVDQAVWAHQGRSLFHFEPDLLRELRPELVLTQELCRVCAVSAPEVEAAVKALGYRPTLLSLSASTLDDMLADVEAVGRAAGVAERAVRLVGLLRARLAAVRRRTEGTARPRVLCLEWLDPPYSAGHWVPEMVEIAGGVDMLGSRGGYSRPIAWEDALRAQPEALLLIPCSLPLARVAAEFPHVRARPGWQELPAVRAGRVFAADTHLFSQAGPRLVDGVEALARMLHPERFEEPLPEGQALRLSADGQRLEPYC